MPRIIFLYDTGMTNQYNYASINEKITSKEELNKINLKEEN